MLKASAAVAAGDTVYIFGIEKKKPTYISVHIFNTVSLRWRRLPPVTTAGGQHLPEVPCSRRGHSAVIIEDKVYIWGGKNALSHEYCSNALYRFDVNINRWVGRTRASGSVPEVTYQHSACVLEKVMYIYGGSTQGEPARVL